jgi:hypothetical protein
MGDAVVHLAAAWWTIATHEGFDDDDLSEVDRFPSLTCDDAAPSELGVADT